jgi:clan AA aspartic protease
MTGEMGKVMTKLTLWNNTDLDLVERGFMRPGDVRTTEVEALVDTGATTLVLPIDVCRQLGLTPLRTVPVRLADGTDHQMTWMGSLRIAILGRDMNCDALAAPEGATALIGQIPLEALDLVVDPRSREIRPNPAHPDGPVLDALRAA